MRNSERRNLSMLLQSRRCHRRRHRWKASSNSKSNNINWFLRENELLNTIENLRLCKLYFICACVFHFLFSFSFALFKSEL